MADALTALSWVAVVILPLVAWELMRELDDEDPDA
jgi:hypothetical protein